MVLQLAMHVPVLRLKYPVSSTMLTLKYLSIAIHRFAFVLGVDEGTIVQSNFQTSLCT